MGFIEFLIEDLVESKRPRFHTKSGFAQVAAAIRAIPEQQRSSYFVRSTTINKLTPRPGKVVPGEWAPHGIYCYGAQVILDAFDHGGEDQLYGDDLKYIHLIQVDPTAITVVNKSDTIDINAVIATVRKRFPRLVRQKTQLIYEELNVTQGTTVIAAVNSIVSAMVGHEFDPVLADKIYRVVGVRVLTDLTNVIGGGNETIIFDHSAIINHKTFVNSPEHLKQTVDPSFAGRPLEPESQPRNFSPEQIYNNAVRTHKRFRTAEYRLFVDSHGRPNVAWPCAVDYAIDVLGKLGQRFDNPQYEAAIEDYLRRFWKYHLDGIQHFYRNPAAQPPAFAQLLASGVTDIGKLITDGGFEDSHFFVVNAKRALEYAKTYLKVANPYKWCNQHLR